MNKYSEATNRKNVNHIIAGLKELIELLKNQFGFKNIESTKLKKFIKKAENNPNNLSYDELCELYANINRFQRIKEIIIESKDNPNIVNLKKMISGSESSIYYSDNSEDAFFEIDFAARMIKLPFYKNININTETDIIFNDSIAIECKKIHSNKKLHTNIKDANNQIIRRISDGHADEGFIAIELTNFFPQTDNKDFFDYIYNKFSEQYLNLKLEDGVFTNHNFKSIIRGYSGNLLEYTFSSMIGNKKIKLDQNVMGIFYQAEVFLPVGEGENSVTAIRMASYYLNSDYIRNDRDRLEYVKRFFHLLASGV